MEDKQLKEIIEAGVDKAAEDIVEDITEQLAENLGEYFEGDKLKKLLIYKAICMNVAQRLRAIAAKDIDAIWQELQKIKSN